MLQAHLNGTQELLHPWNMVHDPLCTAGIRQACSTIHTLLYPAVDTSTSSHTKKAAAAVPGVVAVAAVDVKSVAVQVKAEYGKLVEILVRLLEGSVFAIKTFEQ